MTLVGTIMQAITTILTNPCYLVSITAVRQSHVTNLTSTWTKMKWIPVKKKLHSMCLYASSSLQGPKTRKLTAISAIIIISNKFHINFGPSFSLMIASAVQQFSLGNVAVVQCRKNRQPGRVDFVFWIVSSQNPSSGGDMWQSLVRLSQNDFPLFLELFGVEKSIIG